MCKEVPHFWSIYTGGEREREREGFLFGVAFAFLALACKFRGNCNKWTGKITFHAPDIYPILILTLDFRFVFDFLSM